MPNKIYKYKNLPIKKQPMNLMESQLVDEDEYLRSEAFTGYDDRSCMEFQQQED